MPKFREILTPLSVLYEKITALRNKAYDKEILPVTRFDMPVISVGNLSTGGTGKTPQVEYLIRLLQSDYKLAVLSRGYKRKCKGFLIAGAEASADLIGDEPMQFHLKFPEVIVAVDSDRVNGIKQLRTLKNPPDVIILDDAFQHRSIRAGFNILLTDYAKLYVDDKPLPAGDLRENPSGAKRAEIIVVTKCPKKLSEKEQFDIAAKLDIDLHQTVFFSEIVYEDYIVSAHKKIPVDDLKDYAVLLVTGIANTRPLEKFLTEQKIRFTHLKFPDHHKLKTGDLEKIGNNFEAIDSGKKIILTTEKDYVRTPEFSQKEAYFIPIQTRFISNQNDFNHLILDYVQRSSKNSRLS